MDLLTPDQARGRTLWSIDRYPKTVAMFYSWITAGTMKYEESYGNLANTISVARKEFFESLNGTPRVRPKYFLWGRGEDSGIQVWIAPTTPDAPPDKPADVSIRAVCR